MSQPPAPIQPSTMGVGALTPTRLAGTFLPNNLPTPSATTLPGSLDAWTTRGLMLWNGSTWVLQSGSPASAVRPYFVAAIGDSITTSNQLTLNLQNQTALSSYLVTNKTFSPSAWLLYGAMRSGMSWAPFEYIAAFSGATSATVLATCVPAMLNNPFGTPDACEVLVGTNDVGNSVPVATCISNIKQIYNALLAAGIMPIAATIPPTVANQAICEQLNWNILRIAKEYNIPCVDYYSALTNESGTYRTVNWSQDGTHPTAQAAGIMGYLLNQTIQGWFGSGPRLQTHAYAAALAGFNADPLLQIFTGTINTASSYPTAIGWAVPSAPTLCTMFNSSGTEPGGGHTMFAANPSIMNGANLPNYLGNSFSIAGDGVNTFGINGPNIAVAANVGDKIAIMFRIKWIPNFSATNPGNFNVEFFSNGTACAGINYNQPALVGSAGHVQIGGETAYPAGDFYQEYTVQALSAGGVSRFFLNMNNSSTAITNSGDSLTLSNMKLINLTQAGLLTP